uniref:Uncharacterized protein n=1 Tax=Rhizophora mucronata TaxID=61149 RepID=A0A2P2P3D0_RHIMU
MTKEGLQIAEQKLFKFSYHFCTPFFSLSTFSCS